MATNTNISKSYSPEKLSWIAAQGAQQRQGMQEQGKQQRLTGADQFGYNQQLADAGYASQLARQQLSGQQAIGQIGARAGANQGLAAQQQGFNIANLEQSRIANQALGESQFGWQTQLGEQAHQQNMLAAQEQERLNRGIMGYGHELSTQAQGQTADINQQARQHAAGLTEQSAQATQGRNLAMQQTTHGLNQQTMQNQYNLGQQGAQAAQDRGFAGIDRMGNAMFGAPGEQGGGMFGRIMGQFGGGQPGQPGIPQQNPQFGGMGNFAQSGAGQQIASQYGSNPYQAAMGQMTGGPGGPPPGASPQAQMGQNAQMMNNQNWANRTGQMAGQVAQAGNQFNLGAMGAMSNAGAAAGQQAATRAAPGLQARANIGAGAVGAVGRAMSGVA